MLQCSICLEPIYVFYHKNKSCKCNLRYHINCIKKWYKIINKQECIICKKKDTTDLYKLENIFNKGYEILIHMILILFIIVYVILVVYYSFL